MPGVSVGDDVLVENLIKGLDKWRNGSLFIVCGLSETEPIVDPREKLPEKADRDHPLIRFLDAVASDIAAAFGLDKREKKSILRKFHEDIQKWANCVTDNGGSGTRKVEKVIKSSSTAHDLEDDEPKTPIKKKKKKKKLKLHKSENQSSPAAGSFDEPHGSNGEETPGQDKTTTPVVQERDVQRKMKDKKIGLEISRKLTLDEVPESVKERFGQIYFSKWSKQTLPVLVMNPYSVPPGKVREMWVEMFNRLKNEKRLESMTNLIYWYGAYDDPPNAFSFVSNSKLVSFDNGAKKGYDKLPKAVQTRLDTNKPLSATQQLHVKGLEEMNDDLLLDPSDRTGRLGGDFVETFDMLSDGENNQVGEQQQDGDGYADEAVLEVEEKPRSKKRKKKQNDFEGDMDDGIAKPTKKTKKKKKKIVDSSQEELPPDEVPLQDSTLEFQAQTVEQPMAAQEELEDIGDNEVSSDKEDHDYNYAMADSQSEDDRDDEDFYTATAAEKTSKGKKKLTKVKKEPPKKKEQKTKKKIEKIAKKEKKALSEPKKRKLAQEKFAESEKKYLPLVKKWKKAIDRKDTDAILRIYDEVLPVVREFHVSFITAYDLSPLMKQSKALADGPNRKKLMVALKNHYIEHKDSLPAGFKPKKSVMRDESPMDISTQKEEEGPIAKKTERPDESQTTSYGNETLPSVPTPSAQVKEESMSSKPISRGNSLSKLVGLDKEAPRKPEVVKKKFSLGNLMRPSSQPTPKTIKKVSSSGRLSQSTPSASKDIKLPDWVTGVSTVPPPSDDVRLYGLDFLLQAMPFIPNQKQVNQKSVAQGLEACIYSLAQGGSELKWVDRYWEKIDEVVAAICGATGPGSVAVMIGDGKFQSPDEIVGLSEDSILDSFHGRTVQC